MPAQLAHPAVHLESTTRARDMSVVVVAERPV